MKALRDFPLTQFIVPFSPFIAFTLMYAWFVSQTLTWQAFIPQVFSLNLIILPILYGKYQAVSTVGGRSIAWRLLAFIGMPIFYLIVQDILPRLTGISVPQITFFIGLAVIELFTIFRTRFLTVNLKKFKDKLTMDTIILGIIILISTFWALVFNSIDNPMENQPIHIIIDFKRNLYRFDEFISYFSQFFLIYFCGFIIYWVNHHVLVNRIMAKFGIFHYLWCACLFTLIASPTLSQLALLLPINDHQFTLIPSGDQDPFNVWNLRIAAIIMVFSLPLILAFKWQKQAAELSMLKQQNTAAELKWLQQQINPHFLFNTLNNLYAMTLTKKVQAPQCVLQLANLLRFVVYKGGNDRVTLQDEIAYLKDYIALQQIRVSHKLTLTLDISPDIENNQQLTIAPLLLVVLIENAFKHGIDNSDKASWLSISISASDNTLQLKCENSVDADAITKPTLTADNPPTEGGLGLDNLKRRLVLAYANRHRLQTMPNQHSYLATLSIELDQHD